MSEALVGFVGDVLVDRANPSEAFAPVQDILSAADIMFANLEGAYTDDPKLPDGFLAAVSPRAHNLEAFAEAGFHVVSMANNHIMDAGAEAMLETRARLRARGVHTCGAGTDLEDARAPAIVEANGLRIAFLAYASMFPMGYEASGDSAGLVPLRAYNSWKELSPGVYRPGAQPIVTTTPDENDLTALKRDIASARETADLVVTSFHWGDHRRPFHLTDHERRTARYCIEEGADMVVGHHHHALRGIEWYDGKPILYGLGHFVFDARVEMSEAARQLTAGRDAEDIGYEVAPRAGWPLLPLHEDTRMTMMAWARATETGFSDISILPCRLTADGLVHPLELGSMAAEEVLRYLSRCNRTQGLDVNVIADDLSPRIGGWNTWRVVAP